MATPPDGSSKDWDVDGAEPTALSAPRKLGAYVLRRLLGRGGMGEVWLGFDEQLERDVAIKLMRPELVEDEDALRRFHREARAVARLSHKNIVHVYAFGQEEGFCYFAMEMVEGQSVSEWARERGHVTLEEAVAIILQTIEGLNYAWTRGVVHRDIKPANLMLDREFGVKITDFGLARITVADSQLTRSGTILGSPSYVSPEQARGNETDHRSDMYSLGISFYHLLTNTLPFVADSPLSVMIKHIHDELPEPEELKQLLGGRVMEVLKKMTAKNPEDRYQTYGGLAAAMTALAPSVRVGDSALTPTKSVETRVSQTVPASTPTQPPAESAIAPTSATEQAQEPELVTPFTLRGDFATIRQGAPSTAFPQSPTAPRFFTWTRLALLVVGIVCLWLGWMAFENDWFSFGGVPHSPTKSVVAPAETGSSPKPASTQSVTSPPPAGQTTLYAYGWDGKIPLFKLPELASRTIEQIANGTQLSGEAVPDSDFWKVTGPGGKPGFVYVGVVSRTPPVKNPTQTITYWTRFPVLRRWAAKVAFEEKRPGTLVNLVNAGDSSQTQALRNPSQIDRPDLYELGLMSMARTMQSTGGETPWIDLNPWLKSTGLASRILPNRLSSVTFRNAVYFLPADAHSLVLVYRRDLFEFAGVDLSKVSTWEEFARIGRQLTVPGKRYMTELTSTTAAQFYPFLLQAGGGAFDKDGNVILDNEVAAHMMEWYVPLAVGAGAIGSVVQAGGDIQVKGLDSQYILSAFCLEYRLAEIEGVAPQLKGKLSFMAIPALAPGGIRSSTASGIYLGIGRGSRNTNLALDFLGEIMMTRQIYPEVNMAPGAVPDSWGPAFSDEKRPYWGNQPVGRIVAELGKQSPPSYITPSYAILPQHLDEAVLKCCRQYVEKGPQHFSLFVRERLKAAANSLRTEMQRRKL